MQKADPLIRTKLHLPFIRPGLVSRSRLQDRILSGLCGPLTLITAPAGFGKTTLVASCVIGCGMPAAWLSLDKDDNQTGRFLTYLTAALQAADNRIGNDAAQLMEGIQQAPPEAVLTSLINDLDNTNAEIVLVMDDYHLISSLAVHEEVAFLLEHRPNTLHLVIATRSDPPLPLARLRARGQTVELRTEDLRFSEAEAVQFLNDVMGLHLDAGSVAILDERTEGWIAGLQMAALSMRDRKDVLGFIEGFSGTHRFILDYLLEEVLASQPPEIHRFLVYTSILDRLTAPLCDALLANIGRSELGDEGGKPLSGSSSHEHSASVLEYLERENLFLVSLDDERIWFRYHRLFADLLRARLHQEQPDLVPFLHIRASTWLEQKGFISEAIQHLFAAHEVSRGADLIERYGSARWSESDLSVVQMADSLPREMLINRPKIGLYLAWLLINQGNIEKAYPLLKDMEQYLDSANRNSGQEWIQIIIRLALAFLIPPSSTPGIDPLPDTKILDEIPVDETVLRDAADILYGMALGRRGELDRAAEFSLKCMQREKRPHGTLTIPTLVPFLATIYQFQGRLHAAASLCYEFLNPIKAQGIRISTAGNMDVVLGDVLYEWNKLDEAEKQIREGLQANEPWGNVMTDAFGLFSLARVLQAKGDYDGAMQTVEKFEKRLHGESRPIEFGEAFRTLRVRVQLASGNLQKASKWVDHIHLSEDFQLHKDYYSLTLARIYLAQGRNVEAEKLLSGITSQFAAGNRIARKLETNLLMAASFAGEQRLPEAFGLIESCLALAEPEEYIRIFLDVGEPVRELLTAYLRSDAPGHKLFGQKVLGAFLHSSGESSSGPRQNGLIEPLSGREMEVLNLMALGKTNQEIARQLVVARGTVKAHAASIFRKLDAANRTEAVTRARQLGFLP
jgi:LuxR family transcriptional regulator, maltose regulon positive regulatory protein